MKKKKWNKKKKTITKIQTAWTVKLKQTFSHVGHKQLDTIAI